MEVEEFKAIGQNCRMSGPKTNRVSNHTFNYTDRLAESLRELQAFEFRGNQGVEGQADLAGRIDVATADFNRGKAELTTDKQARVLAILGEAEQHLQQMRAKWAKHPDVKHQIV